MPEPLVCPSCATVFGDEERFCPSCHVPLVHVGVELDHPSARRELARKVKPQYAEGEPVRVIGARHQAEAEFIQGMLLEEGIPSMLRRSMGFDVPDFLAAGPRDVLVPRSGADAARDVLLQAELLPGAVARPAPARLLIWLLLAVGALVLLAWIAVLVRG